MPKNNRSLKIGAIILIALIAVGNLVPYIANINDKPNRQKVVQEPQFQKEGTLHFLTQVDSGLTTVTTIDIEIADSEAARAKGLMFRRSMAPNRGMLFIFSQSEEQGFWMKNTFLPLDILYVNEDFEIVKIYRRTTPLSEISLKSGKEARYVVEVNAGFCTQHGIEEGDRISFERT